MRDTPQGPIILAFVGMPGAGKGTCTTYLAEQRGVPVVHFGNIMYEEVKRRGLDIVRDEKFVREDMRAKEGPAVLAKRVAQKTQEYIAKGKTRIVLDGLYSWSEYKYLRQEFGDQLITIAVTAPRAERWRRVLARKDAHRHYTLEQIKQREIAEIENLEKGGPIAYADYTLTNNQTLRDLLSQLDDVLQKIGF